VGAVRFVRWAAVVLVASFGLLGLFAASGVSAGPAASTGASAAVRFVAGSTQEVCQLAGQIDYETGQPTSSETKTSYGLTAADGGASFEFGGNVWRLFGDADVQGHAQHAESLAEIRRVQRRDGLLVSGDASGHLSDAGFRASAQRPGREPAGRRGRVYQPVALHRLRCARQPAHERVFGGVGHRGERENTSIGRWFSSVPEAGYGNRKRIWG
jgi:hypothetical protein